MKRKHAPAQQLGLWGAPEPEPEPEPAPAQEPVIIWHHHIEVQYTDNTREIVCTHDATKSRKDNTYAAFVGHATPENCYICNSKKTENERSIHS